MRREQKTLIATLSLRPLWAPLVRDVLDKEVLAAFLNRAEALAHASRPTLNLYGAASVSGDDTNQGKTNRLTKGK